jgi:Phage capsid protein
MAGAIFSLPPHYQIAFDNYFRSKMAQQTKHRLAGCYVPESIPGEAKRFDIIGSQAYSMRQSTARAQRSEPSDVPSAFYWVRPRPYDKTTWIDQFDTIMLGQLGDPTGPTVAQHGIAANRTKDIVCLAALGGTRYVGAQGTTTQVLPTTGGALGTGQVIGVTYGSGGANSGLQLAKLTAASFIQDYNDVDEDDRFFAYSARELNNLITNVDQVNSVLYNDVRALRAGRIRDFMGYSFKRTQLVPFSAGSTTVRTCFAWQKSYLVLGLGQDVKSTIDRLPTQSNAWQVYTCALFDATRSEDEGVVQVNCDNSV